ncbi:hypothetical protein HU200_023873 [Digitaria exilis]|uniref:Uncharacterized protein n=1 Tax=Digitaria exilis TaxID=1010633 RepID=A0A835EWG2_9POAL|nr:hypothetical protein HU200_023873 [Digitaria exilis]
MLHEEEAMRPMGQLKEVEEAIASMEPMQGPGWRREKALEWMQWARASQHQEQGARRRRVHRPQDPPGARESPCSGSPASGRWSSRPPPTRSRSISIEVVLNLDPSSSNTKREFFC